MRTNKNFLRFYSVIILFLTITAIGILLSDLGKTWMQHELFFHKKSIMQDIPPGTPIKEQLKYAFNVEVFEGLPRGTRPLSSLMEIIDTKFRVSLWKHIFPHPSISVTWIFTLILSPVLLFLILKRFGFSVNAAFLLISFYLLQPGNLSHLTMLFRPSKPMTNFSIIFCVFLFSEYSNRAFSSSLRRLLFFIFNCAAVYFSFFWDETAILIFPLIPILFPDCFKEKSRKILYILLIPLTYLSFFYFLPYIGAHAGYPSESLTKFKIFNDAALLRNVSARLFKNILITGYNFLTFWADSFGFYAMPCKSKNITSTIILTLNIPGLLYIFYSIYRLCTNCQKKKEQFSMQCMFHMKILLIFLTFVNLFHSYLMISVGYHPVWGIYWYGVYFSPILVLISARIFSLFKDTEIFRNEVSNAVHKPVFPLVITVLFLSLFTLFIHTNNVLKKCHYYPFDPVYAGYAWAYQETRIGLEMPDHTEIRQRIKKIILAGEREEKIYPKRTHDELKWLDYEVLNK